MNIITKRTLTLLLLCAAAAPLGAYAAQRRALPKKESFGRTKDGRAVDLYTLTNRKGSEAKIITYGGIVVSLKVPDRRGNFADVILGYDDIAGYEADTSYQGALIGRYGNRIAKGRFTLNGVEYKLATNNGENHLHGGVRGFDKVVWSARPLAARNGQALELSYFSRDGEEGYPGNLSVRVVYTLTNADELRIDYRATTDKDTVVNLTQHNYHNLAGAGAGDILGHRLTIYARRFTPTDATAIPTGELRAVRGTPFDFTRATPIGARINNDNDEQIKFGRGYDHNFVLDGRAGVLRRAALVSEPTTGRVMEVWTTEPGIQFYSGNYLDGAIGKGGKPYKHRYGFCLETQHFPDSPNRPEFPSTVLRRGATFRSSTVYKFSAR